jgi:hypothetical protein
MSTAVGLGIGALAVIALVALVFWWLAAWARSSMADARAHAVAGVKLELGIETRDETIKGLEGDLNGEYAARKVAEEAARRAIHRLAETGDATDLVDALNIELSALSALSEMHRAPTTTAGEDREGPRPVHGGSQPPALPDAPEG